MYGWFNTKYYITILISPKKNNYMILSTDGKIPEAFPLELEIWQRCWLSLLLCNIVLKVLVKVVKSEHEIWGIWMENN